MNAVSGSISDFKDNDGEEQKADGLMTHQTLTRIMKEYKESKAR